ncbi:MAG: hypothetical protein HQM02_11535 [Magnetococcales bacterium]|nr:hypothetical protein [Magnetococcales bacterium]
MLRLLCYGTGLGLMVGGFLFYLLPPYVTNAGSTEEAIASGIWMVTGGGILTLLPILVFRKKNRL